MSESFTTVRTVGSLLPPDLLGRVVAGDRTLPGMASTDYHLGGHESARDAANRHWGHLLGAWKTFQTALAALPEHDPAVGLTREKWLTVLFDALGYGRLPHTPAGGLVADGQPYPVSHLWGATPIHLLGWGVDLDKRSTGVAGASRRPHSMVQELLNRTDDYLWAILSNGRVLRILRDSTSLSGQAYVEFDLQAMFDGEVFSDFVLLFLTAHQSRVEPRSTSPDADASPAGCWLEAWRTTAAVSGTRALGLLRDGVQASITTLGTGFLRHPANAGLNRDIADGSVKLHDYHSEILHLAYRLLFLFVAEDRDVLLAPDANPQARERYARYYSTARLRRLATTRRGDRHGDLWQALTLVFDALGADDGQPELGLPGIGGLFYRESTEDVASTDVGADVGADPANWGSLLAGRTIANADLLSAIRHLAVVQPKGQPKRLVDYRNLGAEELGGIYESLLELVPRHTAATREFTLETLAGNERKTSGSYYTPTSLIDLVLDETLDPLLDDAQKSDDPEAALLAMTVVDPACGSAHFLVAAARRMARRLAAVRTGDPDPAPTDVQAAMYDVVSRCIYGVDVNPMAAELAKVSLWLEAIQPGRPLAFLDHHIKVGNGLLGATPALIEAGIPDGAYTAIEGDNKTYAGALKRRNRTERDAAQAAQDDLFATSGIDVSNTDLRTLVRSAAVPALSLNDVKIARRRRRQIEDSPAAQRLRRMADAWCAAFVQLKDEPGPDITHDTLTAASNGTLKPEVAEAVDQLSAQYRFFHWHLEFPEVFDVPEGGVHDTQTGWHGGFNAATGNPPWETVQMTEKEFFASRMPEIAHASNAAARTRAIAALRESHPELHAEYIAELRRLEGSNSLTRGGRYSLTARGKVNTYALFAEHMRTIIAPAGRMGVITPTGLATDNTTAPFFADTLRSARLAAFYDFENEAKIFAGVDHRVRFAISVMTGGERVDRARFAFVTRHVEDIPSRRFDLEPDELLLLNPNTGTLPVFRTRTDAEITIGIYRRHPVLIRDGDPEGNTWGLTFRQGLFNMATDSGLFRTEDDLRTLGAQFDGWAWSNGTTRWLPLYEAKMLSHYDHRFSTYENATQAQLNVGSLPRLTPEQHDDPSVEPRARYWVEEAKVDEALADRWDRDWLFGWRDITNAGNERTLVPSVLPRSAVNHKFPVAFPRNPVLAGTLQAVWSSLAFDYVARQKLSGTGMTYFILKQIACPASDTLLEAPPWSPQPVSDWVLPRLLEMTYTSWRIRGYARDLGDVGCPFRWIESRRQAIRTELDAAMFHVYGLSRPEVEHVLDSFFVVRKYEERDHSEFRTRRQVLDRYDAMQRAADIGIPYETLIDPPPGQGPRHPDRTR
jgi:hypothetical protein